MAINKLKLIRIATVILAISFFLQVFTALGMTFFQDMAIKLGILGALAEIHEYNGFVLTFLVLIHLYINRGWIRANIFKRTASPK